jgi:hypothetical protein
MDYEVNLEETEKFLESLLKQETWYLKSRLTLCIIAFIVILSTIGAEFITDGIIGLNLPGLFFFMLVCLEIAFTKQIQHRLDISARLLAILCRSHDCGEAYDSQHVESIVRAVDNEFINNSIHKMYTKWVKDFKNASSKA